MIDHAMARDFDAQDLLSRALKTSPHFHIFHAETAAQTLADISRTRQDLRSSNAKQ
jgi:hypothetical protein